MWQSINANEASDLQIEWNAKDRLEGRDPYFVWADLTRLRGLVAQEQDGAQYAFLNFPIPRTRKREEVGWEIKENATCNQTKSSKRVGLLIERDPSMNAAPAKLDCIAPCALYSPTDRFFTAELSWERNVHVFDNALRPGGIEGWGGFEIGSAVYTDTELQLMTDFNGVASGPTALSLDSQKRSLPHAALGGEESSGEDVIVVIDHGCAFAQPAFLRSDGKTRVAYLWDQDRRRTSQAQARPSVWRRVKGQRDQFVYGAELTSDDINTLLAKHKDSATGVVDEAAVYEELVYDVLRQGSSHGTHVMSLAAGWPNPIQGSPAAGPRDRAGNAKIIFVQLPRDAVADTSGASMNVAILDALAYVRLRTKPTDRVTICLSYGSFSGGHTGRSRLDRAIAHMLRQGGDQWKLFVAAGNAYESACHASQEISSEQPGTFQVAIDPDCRIDTFLEIWAGGFSEFSVRIKPPNCRDFLDAVRPNQTAVWAAPGWPGSDTAKVSPALCVVNIRNGIPADECSTARQSILVAIAPTHTPQFAPPPCAPPATVPATADPTCRDAYDTKIALVAAPAGIWTVEVSTNSVDPVEVRAWIERDDLVIGQLRKGQQARFVEDYLHDAQSAYAATASLKRRGSASNLGVNPAISSVGAALAAQLFDANGLHVSSEHGSFISRYSSVGYPNAASQYKTFPSAYDVADQSFATPGVLAAGNRSQSASRRNGTSVATPIAARRHVNGEAPIEHFLLRSGLLGSLDEAGNPVVSRHGAASRVADYEGILR